MERQKKYKNCVKNSQKELRFENKFVIIAVHGSKNRRRGVCSNEYWNHSTQQQEESDRGFLYCIQGNPHET